MPASCQAPYQEQPEVMPIRSEKHIALSPCPLGSNPNPFGFTREHALERELQKEADLQCKHHLQLDQSFVSFVTQGSEAVTH